jgi:hypothetical protein
MVERPIGIAQMPFASRRIVCSPSQRKELAVLAIYQCGRQNGPFLVANCSTNRETLRKNELFGREQGALIAELPYRFPRVCSLRASQGGRTSITKP